MHWQPALLNNSIGSHMKTKLFVLTVGFSLTILAQQNWKGFVSKQPIHPGSGLLITLNGLPPGSDWVVAIQTDQS